MASIAAGGSIRAWMCQETHSCSVGFRRRSVAEAPTRALAVPRLSRIICALVWSMTVWSLQADSFTTTRSGPRAEVLIVEDLQATTAFRPDPVRVQAMVDRG